MKAMILAAGLGTRLLQVTKEMPKEMFPIFAVGMDGKPCLKPLLQVVFEQMQEKIATFMRVIFIQVLRHNFH